MDFFARQEQSRRTTRYLVLLFALAFAVVALATAVVLAIIFRFLPVVDIPLLSTTVEGVAGFAWEPLLATAGVVLLFMLVASAGRSAMLSRGGAGVARMLGGTEIRSDTTDPAHRRLVNVVEEMAIAAGVPVPDVFVLESESGINAFAAGLEQSDAAVAVTRGALDRLTRAELQGVIAHEFSHILNGDMRINQRLMGFSFGILMLALVGRWILRSMRFARRSRNKGAIAVVVGLALAIIGSIGVFFSRLIKAAVSRQRELLADASAVQFTREPQGLAGALKKIGGLSTELTEAEAEEVAHMLFGRGSRAFRGWFATHPPLIDRIRALEPSFSEADLDRQPEIAQPSGDLADVARAFSAAETGSSARAEVSVADAGRIESAAVGTLLHAAIPEDLIESAHSRESSWLLVVAMVCSRDPGERERARPFLEQRLGAQRTALCLRLASRVADLDVSLRLPLLELCMPALRQRPHAQLEFLLECVTDLTELRDGGELFDFVLPRVLNAWLGRRVEDKPLKSGARLRKREALSSMLAAVASFGHQHADVAAAAWRAGMRSAGSAAPPEAVTLKLRDPDLLSRLDMALDAIRHEPARVKRAVLAAVLVTIRYDRTINTDEVELFRAIAATLDVPSPPVTVGTLPHSG